MPSLLDPSITNPGYSQYTADGSNDTFLVGYDYADRTEIEEGGISVNLVVRVNGSNVTFTNSSGGTLVVLDAVPAAGDEVEVFRDSDFETFLVNWASNTPVSQNNLKRMGSQLIWLAQENLQRLRYLRDQFAVFIDASDLVQAAADEFDQFEAEITSLENDLAALETLFDVTAPTDSQMLVYDTTDFKNKTISGDFTMDVNAVVTIRPNVVGTTELADNAIVTSKINDAAVTFVKLAADTIFFIEFGGIAAASLNNLSDVSVVTPADGDLLVYDTTGATFRNQTIGGDFTIDEAGIVTISANAVDNTNMAPLSVGAAELQTDSVTTDSIAAGAVIAGKLATNSVSSGNIVNQAVTSEKIFDNTVSTAKLQNSSVTNSKIAPNAVTGIKILTETITGVKIANNTLTLSNIASDLAEALGSSNPLYDIVSPAVDDILVYDGSAFKNVQMSGDVVWLGSGEAEVTAGSITPAKLSFVPVEQTVNGQSTVGGIPDTNYLFNGEVVVARATSPALTKAGMHNSRWVSTIATTDATPTDLLPALVIPDGDSWLVHIQITGRDDAGGNFWSSTWHGHISREGASTTGNIIEDGDAPTNKPAGWAATVIIDDTTEEMVIEVTGEAATNVHWAASVEITRTLQ